MLIRARKHVLSQSGFTLIENLVAMLLLAVTLTAGLALYYNGDEIVSLATHKKKVTEKVNSQMEELRALGYDNIPVDETPDPTYFTITKNGIVDGSTTGGIVVEQKVTVPDPGASGYKTVEIQATWREAGKNHEREVKLTTYVAS